MPARERAVLPFLPVATCNLCPESIHYENINTHCANQAIIAGNILHNYQALEDFHSCHIFPTGHWVIGKRHAMGLVWYMKF